MLVHINPRQKGVILPEHLIGNRSVTLRLSRYFRGQLKTTEKQIEADLLFGSDYFTCVIPWKAIWGASSATGEEFVWNQAAPTHAVEVAEESEFSLEEGEVNIKSQPEIKTTAQKKRVNHLTRIK